jgi:hypothetical protein
VSDYYLEGGFLVEGDNMTGERGLYPNDSMFIPKDGFEEIPFSPVVKRCVCGGLRYKRWAYCRAHLKDFIQRIRRFREGRFERFR